MTAEEIKVLKEARSQFLEAIIHANNWAQDQYDEDDEDSPVWMKAYEEFDALIDTLDASQPSKRPEEASND